MHEGVREEAREIVQQVQQTVYWSIDCVFKQHGSCPDHERSIHPPCGCDCHTHTRVHQLRVIQGGISDAQT